MAFEQPLTLTQRAALLSLLKIAATGEASVEQLRQSVCQTHDFHEIFRAVQGNLPKGYITARDIHSWLSEQPQHLPRMLYEDVADVVQPYANVAGEVRYEGFLKLVLPRNNPALRELALSHGAMGHWTQASGYVTADTTYRFCHLIEEEIEVLRQMRLHRRRLQEQGVNPREAYGFLSSERSPVSGVGFVSLTELILLLVHRLGELRQAECEALFRRLASTGGGITFQDVVHLLLGNDIGTRALSPSLASALNTNPVPLSPSAAPLGPSSVPLSPRMSPSPVPLASSLGPVSVPLSPRTRDYYAPLSPRTRDLHTSALSRTSYSDRPISSRPISPTVSPRAVSPRMIPLRPTIDTVSSDALSPHAYHSGANYQAARPPISPRATSPRCTSPRALELAAQPSLHGPNLQAVLAVVERQGQLDEHVEETKALLPNNTPVETVFGLLDPHKKGFVTDADLWQFTQKLGPLSFSSIVVLMHELQNSRIHDPNCRKNELSMREVGALVHRKGSLEHSAMDGSTSDHDARSSLYVLRYTEPCPGCGVRIQRDADAAGCPNVQCPVCRRTFQCYTLMGDIGPGGQPHPITDTDHLFHDSLPVTVQQDLYRIIEAATSAADEIEGLRKQLMLAHDQGLLADTFSALAGGKPSFSFTDLRRALHQYRCWNSEQQLELIWHRYARGADGVTLQAYVQQLRPVMGRV